MSQFLWYIPLFLLAVLLCLMLRNRAYKVCPWFFAYVVFAVAADITRFLIHNYPATLFRDLLDH